MSFSFVHCEPKKSNGNILIHRFVEFKPLRQPRVASICISNVLSNFSNFLPCTLTVSQFLCTNRIKNQSDTVFFYWLQFFSSVFLSLLCSSSDSLNFWSFYRLCCFLYDLRSCCTKIIRSEGRLMSLLLSQNIFSREQ